MMIQSPIAMRTKPEICTACGLRCSDARIWRMLDG